MGACLFHREIVEFEHATRNIGDVPILCRFLCLLCRFGAVPSGICGCTVGGGSLGACKPVMSASTIVRKDYR